VSLRGELVRAGALEAFDPAKHPNSVYHVVPGIGP
jgi:hypothetical protein